MCFIGFASRQVDSVLMIHSGERTNLAQGSRNGMAVFFVDQPVAGQLRVASDNYEGGVVAARQLADFGHQHIGMLIGDHNIADVQERLRGFSAELAERGSKTYGSRVQGSKSCRRLTKKLVRLL